MAAPPSTPTIPLDVLSRQNAPTVLDVIRVFNDNVGYINVRSQTTTASVPGVTTLGSRAGSPYPHTFGAQSANVLMDGFGSALARLVDVSDDARVALAVFLMSTRYSVLHGVDTEPGLQSYLNGLYVQSLNFILRDVAHFAPRDAPGGNWTVAFSPGGGRADFEYRLNGTLVAAGEIKPSSAASDHLIRQEMPTDAPHANIYTPAAASGAVPDDTTPVIAITHCLGRGGTSDVYAATTVPGVPWPVAAKLSVPFAEAMRVNSDSATSISAEDISLAERQVRFMHATEALVLAGPLAKLQGVAVPRFFGAYHALVPHSTYSQEWALAPEASVELWATVMERTERVDFHSMTAADKLAIVGRYRQIHAAGVLHRDPGARHWHRSIEDGRMLVIDFGVSMTRDDIGDGFDVWARDELKQVKEMLGLREPRR